MESIIVAAEKLVSSLQAKAPLTKQKASLVRYMKPIYIAATRQNEGKTTVAIGLYAAARSAGLSAGFIKPVGQRYRVKRGVKVDEDAVLFKQALEAQGELSNINPVTIPRGFTEEYIFNRDPESIRKPIRDAFLEVNRNREITIVEGTGHAGVGSVVDASNARVAQIVGANCIIVSGGGIGRCIDGIALNRALFEQEGVRCIGAVINKVYVEKYERVKKAVEKGLDNLGIRCLGVIPYKKELTFPTVRQLREELSYDVLCGGSYMDGKVCDIIVAAMEPQNMVDYLSDGCLVVVPGDRVDNIVTSINAHLMRKRAATSKIAGLLLTGGLMPHLSIVNLLCQVDVPVLLSKEDTATTAYRVRELVAKITPRDHDKLQMAGDLIRQNIDIDRIFESCE